MGFEPEVTVSERPETRAATGIGVHKFLFTAVLTQ
jgi:hypothetical protein